MTGNRIKEELSPTPAREWLLLEKQGHEAPGERKAATKQYHAFSNCLQIQAGRTVRDSWGTWVH